MKSIRERLNKWEIGWEHLSDSFLLYHPYIGFAVAAVGLPIAILLSVAACTTVVMLPVSYVLG